MARYFLVVDTEQDLFTPGSKYELQNMAVVVKGRMTQAPAVWGRVDVKAYAYFPDMADDWFESAGAFEPKEERQFN